MLTLLEILTDLRDNFSQPHGSSPISTTLYATLRRLDPFLQTPSFVVIWASPLSQTSLAVLSALLPPLPTPQPSSAYGGYTTWRSGFAVAAVGGLAVAA